MQIDDAACDKAGIPIKDVMSIMRRLSKAGKDAQSLGIKIFGGSGHGSLRIEVGGRALVLADLDGMFDGGDGATIPDGDLRYGE